MTALAAPRKIARRDGVRFVWPVAALAACVQSGLAISASGFARPARTGQGGTDALKSSDAATYQVLGVFMESVVGGAADGDAMAQIVTGCFNFINSAGADAVTLADVGKPVFVVDDATIARTSAAGTRVVAGTLVDIDDDGVWVDVGVLSRPASRTLILAFAISEADTLAGTSAELVSPVAGEITRLTVIVQKAVTTGGDITLANGVTAVDGLACAIADAAAKGSVVTDTPTAGHASTKVPANGRIQVIPAAAFATAGAVSGFVEITV